MKKHLLIFLTLALIGLVILSSCKLSEADLQEAVEELNGNKTPEQLLQDSIAKVKADSLQAIKQQQLLDEATDTSTDSSVSSTHRVGNPNNNKDQLKITSPAANQRSGGFYAGVNDTIFTNRLSVKINKMKKIDPQIAKELRAIQNLGQTGIRYGVTRRMVNEPRLVVKSPQAYYITAHAVFVNISYDFKSSNPELVHVLQNIYNIYLLTMLGEEFIANAKNVNTQDLSTLQRRNNEFKKWINDGWLVPEQMQSKVSMGLITHIKAIAIGNFERTSPYDVPSKRVTNISNKLILMDMYPD